MSNTIEIPLSKTKIIVLLIGALLFVITGVVFILYPETFINPIFKTTLIISIVGIAAIVFFGIFLVFIGKKLFDDRVGLIINQNGITDNTSGNSVGLIEWEDIGQIRTLEIASTKIMMIDTDKPEKYIERAKNGLSKRIMKANYKMYGSPIAITSNALKIKYDDLEKLIHKEFEKHKL